MIRSPISSAIRSAWRPVLGPTLSAAYLPARLWADAYTWRDTNIWSD